MMIESLYPIMLRMLLILVAARGLIALAGACDRRCGKQHRELPRKLLHVGMGIIALTYPWLFDRGWPVQMLSAGFIALLLARHVFTPLQYHVAGVIYGVGRSSRGEYYFPMVTAALFYLAHGDRLLYIVPTCLLVFADTAAAIIGSRYGRRHIGKSTEGCTAFFVTAFLGTHIALSLDPRIDRGATLSIALQIAVVATLLEAACGRGLDNLLVPLAGFAMLVALRRLGPMQLMQLLVIELMVTGLIAAICFLMPGKKVRKNDAEKLTAVERHFGTIPVAQAKTGVPN